METDLALSHPKHRQVQFFESTKAVMLIILSDVDYLFNNEDCNDFIIISWILRFYVLYDQKTT